MRELTNDELTLVGGAGGWGDQPISGAEVATAGAILTGALAAVPGPHSGPAAAISIGLGALALSLSVGDFGPGIGVGPGITVGAHSCSISSSGGGLPGDSW